jgi:hypothetical protein
MAISHISQNDHVTVINDSDSDDHGEYNNNEENDDDENDDDFEDDESDEEDNEYKPEETSNTRFNITVCELYNTAVHGPPAFKSLHAHYIVLHRLKKYDERLIDKMIWYYTGNLANRANYKHPLIRNYINIHNQMAPEITECIYLPTGECICIKKTIWIRLVQRTWKKIYKLRQEILAQRRQPRNLFYRGITGSWPIECKYSPSISGMLSALSRI